MNRIDRLVSILTVLQSRKFTAAEYISGHFRISVRTVYRDIKALGEIGVPLGFEAQKGYFVVSGYFLPPLAFTGEESNALVLMESISGNFTDQSIQQHYASALDKIKAVLKPSQREKIDRLQSQIRIHSYPSEINEFRYLAEIQNAIVDRTTLKIAYQNVNIEKSDREVEPIGLTYYLLNWHMIAWCWKRNEYRDFKTSRIEQLVNTRSPFRKETHIDLNEYIKMKY